MATYYIYGPLDGRNVLRQYLGPGRILVLNIKPAQDSPGTQLNDIDRYTIHDCASQSIPVSQRSALLLKEQQ